ncbi:hypothetical protein F5Y02DRAFT_412592 [Annulohypoxylon stygium]|nr:hypothetical protein F5Y02DRAFT_412592 [Annulohypoxylon stygium]
MKIFTSCSIFALACFQTAVLAVAQVPIRDPDYNPAWGPAFDSNLCPEYHLQETGTNSSSIINLVATCSDGSNGTQYHTSSLDLDHCLYNEEGYLFASEPQDFYTGPFSKTCSNCGLSYLSLDAENEGVYIKCTCQVGLDDDRTPRQSMYLLGRVIHVQNYTLGCFEFVGELTDNSIIYPNQGLPASSVATVTATATVYTNITVSPPISPASNTVPSTMVPSTVTITETKWKARKAVTLIKTQTAFSPVTILVSVPVTETPTPTPQISAILFTTVHASFVTLNSSTNGV